MIRLELIEIVKKQFPDLDLSTQEGITQFSELVKSDINRFGYFSSTEVQDVVKFLPLYDDNLLPLINHKNISIILQGGGESITLSPLREQVSEETLLKFKEIFSGNILNYIKQCIKLNEWNNLKNLFRAYSFIINNWIKEETLKLLSVKNQELVLSLQNKEYVAFVEEHTYATDVSYFAMLNTVDERYFDEEILKINYALANYPKTATDNTILGKMMYALSFYNAYNDDVKYTLEATKRAAYSLLNMTDSSSGNTGQSESSGCIVYIILFICYGLLAFIIAPYVSGDVLTVIFLAINFITFIAKKMN